MPSLSAHLIRTFYNNYLTREIAFNHSVIKVTGLEPRKVFLKVKGEQWGCIIYSCSMKNAKVIANMDNQSFEILKRAKNFLNLRMSFLPPENKNSIVFFIPTRVDGYKKYTSKNQNTYLLNLSFTQKPPDDMIEILGKIIKEKEDFARRKDIRINLDGKIIWDIGLSSNKGVAIIENIKRPCILRNISASGLFMLLSCMPKFILNKTVTVQLPIANANKPLDIEGTIIRHEEVDGRKDIYGIAVIYDKDNIPLEYKKIINTYLDKLEDMVKNKK